MYTVRANCGHCANPVDFQMVYMHSVKPISNAIKKAHGTNVIIDSTAPIEACGNLVCPMCGLHSLIMFTAMRGIYDAIFINLKSDAQVFVPDNSVEITKIYPSIPHVKNLGNWPEILRQPFLDVQKHVQVGDNAALNIAGIRSVLDVATKTAVTDTIEIYGLEVEFEKDGETPTILGKSLFSRIEFLFANGIITRGMEEWAQELRKNGNEGTHELKGDPAVAKENLAFLRQFLDLCFTLPATIAIKKSKAVEE